MRNLKFLGIAALAGMLLTSCASVAHVEKDETVNFSKYKSFAWVDAKEEEKARGRTDFHEHYRIRGWQWGKEP